MRVLESNMYLKLSAALQEGCVQIKSPAGKDIPQQ
jgi:hypothetical protein